MPIIAPQSYAALNDSQTVTATAAGRYPVQVHVADPAYWQLFTMAGGTISFVPGSMDPFFLYGEYPDLILLPRTGYLLQRVWMSDIKALGAVQPDGSPVLPAGVPPMFEIVYFNVDPVSLRADLKPLMKSVRLSVLKSFVKVAGTPDKDAYETQVLDKILQGQVGIFVPGGTRVGKMASGNFTLFFTGGDKVGLSPIPFLRNMPGFAGNEWTDHPLINALAKVTVPVDIYAQFRVWSVADKVAKPLPDGLNVRLMDFTPLIGKERLATLPLATGDGKVVFRLTDAQLEHSTLGVTERTPDLFFEIDLGVANPEPTILNDPWGSTGKNTDDALHPNAGYFENFSGTRLGSSVSPLRFQIGLGFWTDLISFRPPASVQVALKAAGRHVQAIEDAFEGFAHEIPRDRYVYSPLSLDYYAVQVDRLPRSYATPEELMSHVRVNFNSEFIDQNNSIFSPTDPKWSNPALSPVGIVLNIDFFDPVLRINLDSGSIVVGAADPTGFTINTIYDPRRDWGHPLGGIRRWGFVANADGTATFFTKGADRPFTDIDYEVQWLIFSGADRLWKAYQQKLAKFVNVNGGSATILPESSMRFDWDKVKPLYWKPDLNNPWIK